MTKKMSFPIIANCNFESRDDEGKAIHKARKAMESGTCDWPTLFDALEDLEDTLYEHADSGDEKSVKLCASAERAVVAAWHDYLASQEEV